MTARGPLLGVRVVEFAGIGPVPFCGMLLSDMGADVVRIDRPGTISPLPIDIAARGRSSIILDLKTAHGRSACLEAIAKADVLIEGFRPGVMERLGLGPTEMLDHNSRLIYARITGWGRNGPLSKQAGHDINYIALTGALAAMGPADRPPPPPLNLVGDFGGGALYLAFGIAAALFERDRSGRGQVVDAAMVDGVTSQLAMFFGLAAIDPAVMDRDKLGLAGARPNYRCYECSDGQHVAVGALEQHFSEELLARLGLPLDLLDEPDAMETLAATFRTKTRDEWAAIFAVGDACVVPVLSLAEAPDHPQFAERQAHVEVAGVVQPGATPAFSRTPGAVQGPPPSLGEGGLERWRSWGVAGSGLG